MNDIALLTMCFPILCHAYPLPTRGPLSQSPPESMLSEEVLHELMFALGRTTRSHQARIVRSRRGQKRRSLVRQQIGLEIDDLAAVSFDDVAAASVSVLGLMALLGPLMPFMFFKVGSIREERYKRDVAVNNVRKAEINVLSGKLAPEDLRQVKIEAIEAQQSYYGSRKVSIGPYTFDMTNAEPQEIELTPARIEALLADQGDFDRFIESERAPGQKLQRASEDGDGSFQDTFWGVVASPQGLLISILIITWLFSSIDKDNPAFDIDRLLYGWLPDGSSVNLDGIDTKWDTFPEVVLDNGEIVLDNDIVY